jgi:hypothetical protein
MGFPVRRSIGEAIGSAACFVAVLTALVMIDERVRTRMTLMFSGNPSGQLNSWSERANLMVDALAQAARDQSIAHAPMLMFTLVAIVLVIFMLRT